MENTEPTTGGGDNAAVESPIGTALKNYESRAKKD